jgi:hypothetical protein
MLIVCHVISQDQNALGEDGISALYINPLDCFLEDLKAVFRVRVHSNIGQREYKDKDNLPIFVNSSLKY